MGFYNSLCQEIDQRRMDVVANQNDVRGCNEDQVGARNDPLKVNHSPRQDQSSKKRENAGDGLRLGKAHGTQARVFQQGLQNWRIERDW